MQRIELLSYLDTLLSATRFRDYAPNGLQIEGKAEIKTIVTAVTADQYAIEQAIALQADCLLVHHGYFWKNEAAVITGMKQRRIKALLQHDINLIGYHLPLDAHLEFGNNVQLGRALGLANIRPLRADNPQELIFTGELPTALDGHQFSTLIEQTLGRRPLHIAGHQRAISRVGWCTGGAQDYIDEAAQFGLDAFISGEVSERTYHSSIEQEIDYFAAGHHATERGGIRALGEHLALTHQLIVHFVDTPNPI
ncbi:MAG: Nif3-like dinuclear metal center hexameric protein [Ferrimonas sp.]